MCRTCLQCGSATGKTLLLLCSSCYGAEPGLRGLPLVVPPGKRLPSWLQPAYSRFVKLGRDGSTSYDYEPECYPSITPRLTGGGLAGRAATAMANGRPVGPQGFTTDTAIRRLLEEAQAKYSRSDFKSVLRPGRLSAAQLAVRAELARCIGHAWNRPRITDGPKERRAAVLPTGSDFAGSSDELRATNSRPNTSALAAYLGCDETTIRALRKRGLAMPQELERRSVVVERRGGAGEHLQSGLLPPYWADTWKSDRADAIRDVSLRTAKRLQQHDDSNILQFPARRPLTPAAVAGR